jgi:hypothetical protein
MRKFTKMEIEKISDMVELIMGEGINFVDTEILSVIKFNENDYDDYESYTLAYLAELIQDEFDIDVTIDMGATKLVIMEKGQDYVIKVPLEGIIEARFDEDAEEEGDFGNMYYYCIDDAEHFSVDYCQIEAENYKKMPESVKKILCESVELGQLSNGTAFYVQERIDHTFPSDNCMRDIRRFSEEQRDKAYSLISSIKEKENFNYQYELRTVLVNELILAYGEATTYELYQALIDLQINDIHLGNLGFDEEGALKIFDYSGFFR